MLRQHIIAKKLEAELHSREVWVKPAAESVDSGV